MTNENRPFESENPTRREAPRGGGLQFLGVTPLRPCPYLRGRLERSVVTRLAGPRAGPAYDVMLRGGFRRSHLAAYRPACPRCRACVSVRVRVAAFTPSRSFRRVLARNAGVALTVMPALARSDHYALFRRYLAARHPDGTMTGMGREGYSALVEESAVETRLAEFREPGGRLYGVCMFDVVADGLSAVYSFYEPQRIKDSPGSYMLLRLLDEARTRGLPYFYLGYWIDGCDKMDYKARFRPLEVHGADGWTILDDRPDGRGISNHRVKPCIGAPKR